MAAVDQIQIKWKAGDGRSYEDSVAALKQYGEAPSIKGSVILSGNYTQVAIDQIIATAQGMGLDAKMAFELSYTDEDSIPRYIGRVNLKREDYSQAMVDSLIATGRELGLEPAVVLTATWGNNQEVAQMQLFPPPPRRQSRSRNRPETNGATEPEEPSSPRGTPENPDDFDLEQEAHEAAARADVGD